MHDSAAPSADADATPQPRRTPRTPGRGATVAGILTAAIMAAYVFVSMAYVTPSSPVETAVREVLSPYFTQRWNVFAPNILKANRELEVQVQWREDGELVHSDWIALTDIEYAAVRGIPTPSRISKNSYNAMSAYMSRYVALTDDQRDRVRDTFIEAADGGDFRAIPNSELIDEIDELGDSRSSVIRFLRYDYMLMRYAQAVGEAYFDEDVERVRWRVVRDKPNDFLHRFDDERQTEVTTTTFGWRMPWSEVDPAVAEIYDDVIERYAGR
ncbi:DUF5819 family protein [Microbacterium sp. SSW1-59]|uniref:DUF5819 family protein n=1 Tax=Microbacterium xanthum TaxID=3079794 RepID=UPI002AD3F3FD|nr:DUF5819 family protein [Microbacterium sp. SSW1-59]MDZ8201360.1 DUF5819 family protein [Microbacterium sp. SSW1-59]